MFDFNKLADVSKLASEAKEIQKKQELITQKQIELLEKICQRLDAIVDILKNKNS